jgi:hypothetical protein
MQACKAAVDKMQTIIMSRSDCVILHPYGRKQSTALHPFCLLHLLFSFEIMAGGMAVVSTRMENRPWFLIDISIEFTGKIRS